MVYNNSYVILKQMNNVVHISACLYCYQNQDIIIPLCILYISCIYSHNQDSQQDYFPCWDKESHKLHLLSFQIVIIIQNISGHRQKILHIFILFRQTMSTIYLKYICVIGIAVICQKKWQSVKLGSQNNTCSVCNNFK